MRFHRGWIIAAFVATLPLAIALIILFALQPTAAREERLVAPKPEAPPDLEKLRPTFTAGLDALRRGDGHTAVKHFGAFTFGNRAVEQYRLYFLAQAHDMAGDAVAARRTIAGLWARSPKLVGWDDIGNRLATKYADAGDAHHAYAVAANIAERTDAPPVAASARWQCIQSALVAGDVAAALDAARRIAIQSPRATQAADAIEIVRAITGIPPNAAIPLTPAERLERAVALMRDGDPQHALDEMNALAGTPLPADLREPLQLNRGLALNQLHRYEDSNKLLEPLTAGQYEIAIPAIYTASKNYRVLSNSINPIVIKTIVVRQKVGTVKVRPKGKKKKVITRPKYANVKKNIQLIDLAKKAKKEMYDRLATERLKDLLSLPLADEVRIEVLNTMIALAEAKNQDAYEQQLIVQLARVDPNQDAGLQHFWDKAWAAYARGDLKAATDLCTFIRDTYRNPNVRRQAQYWYARSMERQGNKEEAAAIYRNLAAAPYADVYAMYAVSRGAQRQESRENPLKTKRADWPRIAEQSMPSELRLAYELTALADFRDARLEIQRNLKHTNETYAAALMGDLYNSSGDTLLMMRSLRRAYPQLGSVEQDSVPAYFLRMYYPTKYQDAIFRNAKKNDLDPYVIMGLIHQESYYNPKARSVVGATGLMQLMPATGKEIAHRLHTGTNLENPDTNIRLGTYYFRMLVNMFGGNTNLAIASYNAGQGNVMKWRRAAPHKPMDEFLESIPFTETRNYVKRVNMNAASYRRLTL